MNRILIGLTIFTASFQAPAQELYPNSEPASIVPKKAIGLRSMNEVYNNAGNLRVWNGLMVMYGINSKWMISGMITASNHHSKILPTGFLKENADGKTIAMPNPASSKYSYLSEALSLGFRYRFLNIDGDHSHFRMAAYGNGIYSVRPHDEAEVTTMGDNKGITGGLISTLLLHKLAISLTTGAIKPFSYRESQKSIELRYGNAYNYSLSFGYLVYPRKYKSFNQTNINLYAEFLGKSYGDLKVIHHSEEITASANAGLKGNTYVEFRPSVQFIVKSNLRIDFGTVLPVDSKSYIRRYPMYQLNFQYYFF